MTEINELSISSIINGNSAIATYRRNGLELGINPLEEWVVLRFNSVAKNATKSFDLSTLPYLVSVQSVWIFSTNPTKIDITMELWLGATLTTRFVIPTTASPFTFPPNIAYHKPTMKVTPSEAVDRITFFLQQAIVLDEINVI